MQRCGANFPTADIAEDFRAWFLVGQTRRQIDFACRDAENKATRRINLVEFSLPMLQLFGGAAKDDNLNGLQCFLKCNEQCGVTCSVIAERWPGCAQRFLGSRQIACLAE